MLNNSLYLVLTSKYCPGVDPCKMAEDGINGGADIVQMREKDLLYSDLLKLGKRYSSLCRQRGVIFIVNDDPKLACDVGSDGVHLGQEDLKKTPIIKVRDIIGNKIIGVSTHSLKQFREANNCDVDYIAYGPIFETRTKDYYIGTIDIKTVLEEANKPIVFIGGIDLENIDLLISMGCSNIAVIRAIMQAKDITKQTRKFKDKMRACCEIKD